MSHVCCNPLPLVPNNLTFVRFFAEEVHKANRGGTPIPPLSDILKFHDKNYDVYFWVCTTMMKSVVGTLEWNPRHKKELLSNIATRSDEAFLVLTLENNYDRWMQESTMGDDEDSRKNLSEALYTNSGASKSVGKGSSRRYHGWSVEGYKRFNDLYNQVTAARKLPSRINFEYLLKDHFVDEYMKQKYRNTEAHEEEEEEIFPANDFGVPGSYANSSTASASLQPDPASDEDADDE